MTNAPHLIAERFFHPAPNASPSSRFGLESKMQKAPFVQALRRTGCTSADVATGRGDLSRPALVGAKQAFSAFARSLQLCKFSERQVDSL